MGDMLHNVGPMVRKNATYNDAGAPGRTVLCADGALLGKYDIINNTKGRGQSRHLFKHSVDYPTQ